MASISAVLYLPFVRNTLVGEWSDGSTKMEVHKDRLSLASVEFKGDATINFDYFYPHYLCLECDHKDGIYDITVEIVFMEPNKVFVTAYGGELENYSFELLKKKIRDTQVIG